MSQMGIDQVIESIRICKPPAGMRARVVAIDGHGGAGKSTLAAVLAGAFGAPIVHTDDFASWDNPVDWWPDLIEKVLVPLASGDSPRFSPTVWGGQEREDIVIPAQDIVLLEGVSASREAFRPYLAYSIWVETPRELCMKRGLTRDGEEARADWERWLAAEDEYIAREDPAAHVDAILAGDAESWHRPAD